MKRLFILLTSLSLSLAALNSYAAWDTDEVEEYDKKAQVAISDITGADEYFNEAVAYVVIPTVGKAGFGIGGARGKGVLYEAGVPTALVTLTQLSFGFQWGGQAYSEFLFFQDDAALQNFKQGNYELGAQASAVAWTAGASFDAEFIDGVAIVTVAKGGLMYEASVGGQKFKVEAK